MSDFLEEPNDRCAGANCGRPIRWVRWGDRVHPIDPEPVDDGNLMVAAPEQIGFDGKKRRAIVVHLPKHEASMHGHLYVSHYRTCPNAADFRRYRGRP